MLKFIEDLDASLGKSIPLPSGNYAHLYIESEDLTVPTGEASTAELILTLNGIQIMPIPLVAFTEINNVHFGKPTYTTTTGATNDTITLAQIVPFSFPDIPNAISVSDDDSFYVEFRAGNLNGGTLSLYGIFSDSTPENFIPHLNKFSLTQAGRTRFHFPLENILHLYIDPRATSDKITITKDNKVIADAYGVELIRKAEIFSRIESGTLNYAYENLAPSCQISEVLSDNVEVVIEHGSSGTSTIYAYSLEFIPARIINSGEKVNIEAEHKLVEHMQKKPSETEVILPILEAISPSVSPALSPSPGTGKVRTGGTMLNPNRPLSGG